MSNANHKQAIDRHVGQKIRWYRLQQGYSQSALAEQLCISYQQLHKYENGTNSASASRLAEIAEALHINVAAFFDGFESDDIALAHHAENHRQHMQFIKYYNQIRSQKYRDVIQLLIRVLSSDAPLNAFEEK